MTRRWESFTRTWGSLTRRWQSFPRRWESFARSTAIQSQKNLCCVTSVFFCRHKLCSGFLWVETETDREVGFPVFYPVSLFLFLVYWLLFVCWNFIDFPLFSTQDQPVFWSTGTLGKSVLMCCGVMADLDSISWFK